MNALDLGVNLFVALFALVDPIGNIPIFAAATAGASARQRLSVSALICVFIAVFLAFFFFTGLWLLQFFGISLAAFRIAGGILLLLLGLDMTRDDFLTMFADADAAADAKDVRGYASRRFKRLIVPFAMPLLIGPGAISTIIIQAGEATKIGYAGTIAGLLAIGAASAGNLRRLLGNGPDQPGAGRCRHGDHRARAGIDPVRPGDPVHPRRPGRSVARHVRKRRDRPLPVRRALVRAASAAWRDPRRCSATSRQAAAWPGRP